MDLLAAIEIVLSQVGTPLHYIELTRRVLDQGLWITKGRTPEATASARLSTDIHILGNKSRFQWTGPGMFALRSWGLPEATQARNAADGSMVSFTDAAEIVLNQYAERKPMHYREITKKALELGLIATAGQTPAATLSAQIMMEIKRSTLRGEPSRFIRHGKGIIGLTTWMEEELELSEQITQHNDLVRDKLLERLHKMPFSEFEELIGELLVALGFEEVEVTRPSHDNGIDVRGTLVVGDVIRTQMAVQVKRWQKNIQAPLVQQVRGSLGTHDQGLIITTSNYSQGARTEADRHDAIPVALMTGHQLVDLLIENNIGIRRTPVDLIDLEEDDELDNGTVSA